MVQEAVYDQGLNVAEGVDRAAKVAAVVHKRIGGCSTEVSVCKPYGSQHLRLLPGAKMQRIINSLAPS